MDNELKEMLGTILAKLNSFEDNQQKMQSDITAMQNSMNTMQNNMDAMQNSITDIKLSLENETNKNIQLLAENHSNLIDKLNQAIRVSDKTTLYEIQVNFLKGKVEHLEKEVAEIKNRIA